MRRQPDKLRNYQGSELHNHSRGYILITLMLFVTLLAIAAMAVLPEIAFQIKRDREEEMIHRALAYSRAVKRYYKKFGRYPSRLEELENTNNIRFLRKRYKDPVNKDQDFKILHFSDVMLNSGPVMGQAPGQSQPAGNPKLPQSPGLPGPANAGDLISTGGKSSTQPDGQTNPNASVSSSSSSSNDTSGSTQQVSGGGPILGVASASTEKTIREFYDKNHYNDWLFIYDPRSDRGGMLTTPVQPNLNNIPGAGQPAPNAVPRPGGPPQPQGPPTPQPMPPDQ